MFNAKNMRDTVSNSGYLMGYGCSIISLIDIFQFDPELHKNVNIISWNHDYFGKPSTNEDEKKAAAANAAEFTKKLPFIFSEVSITRKMSEAT